MFEAGQAVIVLKRDELTPYYEAKLVLIESIRND